MPGSQDRIAPVDKADHYPWALHWAAVLRALARRRSAVLPERCPYTFEQFVTDDWYPEPRHAEGLS